MDYKDIMVKCVENTCETPGKEFLVTAGEQSFFASKGFPIPKRCKQCRQNKKNRAESPFLAVAQQITGKSDYSVGRKDFKKNDRKGKRHQSHRRHGREEVGNFEGGY